MVKNLRHRRSSLLPIFRASYRSFLPLFRAYAWALEGATCRSYKASTRDVVVCGERLADVVTNWCDTAMHAYYWSYLPLILRIVLLPSIPVGEPTYVDLGSGKEQFPPASPCACNASNTSHRNGYLTPTNIAPFSLYIWCDASWMLE